MLLSAPVFRFKLGNTDRRFISFALPFKVINEISVPVPFQYKTGQGEQRTAVESQVRHLAKDMPNAAFTPTAICLSCLPEHHEKMKITDRGGQEWVELDVTSSNRLRLTDGMQRRTAILKLRENFRKAKNETAVEEIENAIMPVTIFLDGDSRRDFINLQKGVPISRTQLIVMQLHNAVPDEVNRFNYELAVALQSKKNIFQNQIKFDTSGLGRYPFNTISQKGASDLSSSTMGIAKIALKQGIKKTEGLVARVQEVFQALELDAKELLDGPVYPLEENGWTSEPCKVICPPPNGTYGSVRMFLGLVALYVYRLGASPVKEPGQVLDALVKSAVRHLNHTADGLTNQSIRALLREFAMDFLSDVEGARHEGLPKDLLETLSPSAYGCSKIPKEKPVKATQGTKSKTQTERKSRQKVG